MIDNPSRLTVLNVLSVNNGLTMDQLIARKLTSQSRSAFKQMIYRIKEAGDIDQNSSDEYVLTAQGFDLISADGKLKPDPDACPDCGVAPAEQHLPHCRFLTDPDLRDLSEAMVPGPIEFVPDTNPIADREIALMSALATVMRDHTVTEAERSRAVRWFEERYGDES